ncbi:MAG TPA: hypothetical protein VGF69_24765 [Thermoanaerobaculia bacterium]
MNSVVCAVVAGLLMSTSKYGSRRVAAGATLMSQLSSLLVVVGAPVAKVAFETGTAANAEPATIRVAMRAQTKNFFINLSPTLQIDRYEPKVAHPVPDTITSESSFVILTHKTGQIFQLELLKSMANYS